MKFNELSEELQELWTRGVDHSKFNEDWATAGGVVKVYGKEAFFAKLILAAGDWGYFSKCVNKNGKPLFTFDADFKQYDDETLSDYVIHRMATPSECAEAGIDYVPFMGWRDIESAPNDTNVLLKHESHGAVIGRRNPRFEAGTPCFFSEQVRTVYRQDVKNFDALAWMPLPLV